MQHQNTSVAWTWPQPQIDAKSPEAQKQMADIFAWLGRHGLKGGGYATIMYQMEQAPVSGGENPPNWPFVVFSLDWTGKQATMQFDRQTFDGFAFLEDNPRCLVSDFYLVTKSPSVLLIELQNRFQFGNPMETIPYPDPVSDPPSPQPLPPVKPAVPVGNEILPGSGSYYCLDSTVADWTDARGHFILVEKPWPFGMQRWFKKQ